MKPSATIARSGFVQRIPIASASTWLSLALAGFCLLVVAAMTKTVPESWNDMSRVAAIESRVERGTWSIDDSPWDELTHDKVFLNGRFYSDKMPLLTAAGVVIYALLHRVWGLTLSADCAGCAYYWVTFTLVGLPAAALVFLFSRFTVAQGVPLWAGAVATLLLAFGTMVLPYSLVLNHHLPAAASLFASFFLLTRIEYHPTAPPARSGSFAFLGNHHAAALFAAGLFAALALVLEPPAGIFTLCLGLLAFIRVRWGILYFILGAIAPLAITAWLDYDIAGTVTPPYLIPGAFSYPGSEWPDTVAGTATPDDPPQYAFKMLFGAQGLYAYSPILFFALLGIVITLFSPHNPLRWDAALIGLGWLALTFYLVSFTGDLGGVAYGERYYLSGVPLIFAFIVFAPPLAPMRGQHLAGVILAAFAFLSVVSAYQGALRPWKYSQPPAHPSRNAETGAIGFRWNLRFPIR